jgi:U4/U6 small nuclear ribonucleoprotein PRP3
VFCLKWLYLGIISVLIFRIDNLEHRQHLFKVNTNAQQYKLTGIGIISDSMNLVVVEGGPKGINAYKKIMLNRIDWQTRPEGAEAFKEPNKCLLIWEGEVRAKSFKNFKLKTIPNSLEAKAYLETMNAAQYWNIAAKHVNDAF